MDYLTSYIDYVFDYFNNPASRLNWLYLLSSLLLAVVYFTVGTSPKSKATFIKLFFPNEIIQHPSTRVDLYLLLFNAFLKLFLFAPFVFSATYLAQESRYLLTEWFGKSTLVWDDTTVVISYTLAIWLIGDFSRFLLHYALHTNRFLWEIHKTHHSPEVLNPLTQFRVHPVEQLLFFVRNAIVIGIITGVFKYFFFYQLSAITVIGVNVGRFVFLIMGANLRHSHIPLRFGKWVEYIFISPAQHQIHHGVDEKYHNKNMGSQLAIWDWLFGTLRISEKGEKINFGIGEESKVYQSFLQNISQPIKAIFKSIGVNQKG